MTIKLIHQALLGATLLVGAGAATAQTGPKTTPQPEPSAKQQPSVKPDPSPGQGQKPLTKSEGAMKPESAKITLTDKQAKSWVDKPIYSSDGKEIGEVAAFKRGAGNTVIEMHADVGGMLGMGETRVKLTPQQFRLQDDRVVLNMTEAQAKNLPEVES